MKRIYHIPILVACICSTTTNLFARPPTNSMNDHMTDRSFLSHADPSKPRSDSHALSPDQQADQPITQDKHAQATDKRDEKGKTTHNDPSKWFDNLNWMDTIIDLL